jgi:hypothetical protein
MSSLVHLFIASNACGTHTGVAPSLYDGLNCDSAGNFKITNVASLLIILGNVARILIWLAGALAVIFIIVGAIFYITSAGDPGRIKRAKDILVNAGVGLMLTVTAYAVVTFIAKGF